MAAPRKPLDPNCEGGVLCMVQGHVKKTYTSSTKWRIAHIPLTPGQRKTLDERRDAK
jgi:hypothetical protein